MVQEIFDKDYTKRFKPEFEHEDRIRTRGPGPHTPTAEYRAQSRFSDQVAHADIELHR